MRDRYNFEDRCPSAHDFEQYLQNSENVKFTLAFKKHIEQCELCNEAIQGFQMSNISNINNLLKSASNQFNKKIVKNGRFIFKILSYAASIILLIGISSVFYNIQNQKIIDYQALNFDYSMISENSTQRHKTLAKKSTEQFIYIGNCSKISYNDQYLSPDMLNKALNAQKGITLIRVEVGNDNFDCTNEIINSIKRNQSVPVLTIR